MQQFFTDYLSLLEDCHNGILQSVEALPLEALDWIPGSTMNSVTVLVFHVTGSVRFWIGDVAAQDPSNRDREAEFRARDIGMDVLRKRLEDNLEYARNTLEKMSLSDLDLKRVLTDGRERTVAWALLHALEHATSHLGQIQITRQLWEQQEENS